MAWGFQHVAVMLQPRVPLLSLALCLAITLTIALTLGLAIMFGFGMVCLPLSSFLPGNNGLELPSNSYAFC